MEKNSSRDVKFKPVCREEKNVDVQQLSYTTDFLGWIVCSDKKLKSMRSASFWQQLLHLQVKLAQN